MIFFYSLSTEIYICDPDNKVIWMSAKNTRKDEQLSPWTFFFVKFTRKAVCRRRRWSPAHFILSHAKELYIAATSFGNVALISAYNRSSLITRKNATNIITNFMKWFIHLFERDFDVWYRFSMNLCPAGPLAKAK